MAQGAEGDTEGGTELLSAYSGFLPDGFYFYRLRSVLDGFCRFAFGMGYGVFQTSQYFSECAFMSLDPTGHQYSDRLCQSPFLFS